MEKKEMLDYKSESSQLVQLNNNLSVVFDAILREYYKLHNIKQDYNEYFMECFSNPEQRLKIMTEGIQEIDNYIDTILGLSVEEIYNLYIELDSRIADLQDKILDKLAVYEKACSNIGKKKIDAKDIKAYFDCVLESYQNYLNNGFEEEFSFKSTEMRNSLHSYETDNGRQEIDIDLSIPHDKVLHLMELPNPSKTNDFFSDLYNLYCNNYPEEIKNIRDDIIHYNTEDIDTRVYMYFINNIAKKFVNAVLFDNNTTDEKERIIIEKIKEKYKRDDILEEISISFQKCINFRKVYEYKFIPEIVLDYQYDKNLFYKEQDEKRYSYMTPTSAFTKLGDERSKPIGELIGDSILNGKIILKEGIVLSPEEIKIIECLLKEFNNNLDVRIAWENGKIKIDNNRVTIRNGDKQYKYYLQTNTILSDLPVNTFLISYEEEDMKLESIISESCIQQSIIILSYKIAKELSSAGIDYNDKLGYKSPLKSFRINLNNMMEALSIRSNDAKYTEKINDCYEKLKKEQERVLVDLKRSHLLNNELIAQYVNYFLKNNNTKFENIFKETMNIDLEDYIKENISKSELLGLTNIMKSYFRNDLGSVHFRRDFGIVSYKDGKTPDEQPEFAMIMKLSQKMKEAYEKISKKNPDRFDKSASMIGFCIDRYDFEKSVNGKTIKEKYAKTFMGKTMLQVISDLRIRGRAYKLDCIYDKKMKKFYSIIPLKKYSPQYIKQKIKNNNEDLNNNKGGRNK